MMRMGIAILLLGIFFPAALFAQTRSAEEGGNQVAAMADSLLTLKIFDLNSRSLKRQQANKFGYDPDSVPVFSEEVIAKRIARLDSKTPLRLEYNDHVKGYVDMYARRKREQVERMLGLAQLYYPLFEEKLDKYDIPLELKHLAVVESALNPTAKSRAGAVGLWQFMYGTGKMFGLQTNSFVDERSDPYKATEAACKYLKFLYGMFGDWHLALAAYNAGPGTVNKAIRRSGGKTSYWELMPYLPSETNGYVPAFIAANYVMSYHQEHNLYPVSPKYFYNQVDTVYPKRQMTFSQLSAALNIPVEEIEFLNPAMKTGVVPVYEEAVPLCLPRIKMAQFVSIEEELYASLDQMKAEEKTVAYEKSEVRKIHTVKQGEHLSLIARKYNCSVTDIRQWNKLRSNAINTGQKLTVYVVEQKPVKQSDAGSAKTRPAPAEKSSEGGTPATTSYYVVQPGDTLWGIANKHQGVSVEDIMRLNNIGDARNLKPGMKIKITGG